MPAFIASSKFDFVYLSVPKAGCTSVKNWMYHLEHGRYPEKPLDIHKIEQSRLIHFDNNRSKVYEALRRSFVFTLVRHPLKRAYSLFNEKILHQSQYAFGDAQVLLKNRYGASLRNESLEECRADFLAFLNLVRDTQRKTVDFRLDWHWIPQTVIINDALRFRTLDFIGRVETMDQDMEFVMKRTGATTIPFPRFNEGPKSKFAYEEVLTDRIRDLGKQIYATDLENFAYSI
ncbi:sulfotransferase family protein [Shinella daejeonensis]|uniref:sulfotransferase family 2 domain-containing protein n=1 Tax=Shinella daejeonensis TaxID=659017 RepID=UPI0020C7F2E1|nr:sulfotransferase family 2 domain-containing protein [Shinella daejeonensis]MCP8896337.1 sulfotransferase family protein [Shinella daejeonensis]